MRAAVATRPHEAVARVLMLDGLLYRTFMQLLGAQSVDSTPWSATATIERLSIAALRRLVSHVVELAQARVPTGKNMDMDKNMDMNTDVQRWRAKLFSAVMAELLGEQLHMPLPVEARFYVLSGLTGAAAGGEASTLVRYRHYPVADLMDAPLLLRLAVTALAEPALRVSYAAELLGLGEQTLMSVDRATAAQLSALLQASGLPADWDAAQELAARDELRELQGWMHRAQLWRDTLSFAPGSADPTPYLERAFCTRVVLLAESVDGQVLAARNHPDIRLTLTNPRSQIARGAANGSTVRIALWETTAHIDHAIFAALKSEELLLTSAVGKQGKRVLLSSPFPSLGPEASHIALRFAMGEWVEHDDRVFEASENLRRELELVSAASDYEVRELIHETGSPLAVIANYLHLLRNTPTQSNEEAPPTERASRNEEAQPIEGLLTATSLHTDDPGTRQRNEYLQVVEAELARATTLLQARSDQLSQRARNSPFDVVTPAQVHSAAPASVSALLSDVRAALQPLAERSAVLLDVLVAADPHALVASSEYVRQILINITRNAIEAAPASSGTVRLGVRDGRYRNGRAHRVFEVADNGPGLSHEHCSQLTDAKLSTKGSAGMGLAIAHRLARDQIGGSLDYESGPEGTVFKLWVPLGGL